MILIVGNLCQAPGRICSAEPEWRVASAADVHVAAMPLLEGAEVVTPKGGAGGWPVSPADLPN